MRRPPDKGFAAAVGVSNAVREDGPDAVEAILRASAHDLDKLGVDGYYGSGRVDAARAVGLE